MKTVKDVLDAKGREVINVSPEETVLETVRLMKKHLVGAVLVMSGDKLEGMVTERDCAWTMLLQQLPAPRTPASRIMSTNVLCVAPEQTIDEAMALMTDKRTRHLPVVEGDSVLGLISIGDLVKAKIGEQQFMIDQLERYISS